MFISASRRTDIPAFYSEWLVNRFREGFLYTRNPLYENQLSRIILNPDVIDGIVFWSKNPGPMFNRLREFDDYMYYFQFTLNSYGKDVEVNVPSKNDVLIPDFKRLSDRIGPDRVIWRYDPIFISDKYSADYHIQYFEKLAKQLSAYTRKCTISILDMYKNTEKNVSVLGIHPFDALQIRSLIGSLAEIAHSYGLKIDTCAEDMDLSEYGVGKASCIDGALFEKLLGCRLNYHKDPGQRHACGCMESIDIGAYNTCSHNCRYCYANFNNEDVHYNYGMYDPSSPVLIGHVTEECKIHDINMHSLKETQLEFSF